MTIRRTLSVMLAAIFAVPLISMGAILRAKPVPEPDAKGQAKKVIIRLDADGATDDQIPINVVGDADVRIHNVDVNDDASGSRHITVIAGADAPAQNIESGGPWLGVQFGPVPKPLASHLRLEDGRGQMVLNVLEGSPADLAGLQKYDVITAIDGIDSSSDIGSFLDQIRGFEPNDVATFNLIRGGAPTTTTLTIGTRPDDTSAFKYKYEDDTAHVAHGNVFRRGGIMQKDDSGNWFFQNLGDVGGAFNWSGKLDIDLDDDHFNALLKDVPFGLKRDVTVQSINGESVRIETDDDGSITVTKESTSGDQKSKSTATYANEDEFKQADPDTFERYKDRPAAFAWSAAPGPHMLFLNKNGPDDDVDLNIDNLDGVQKRIEVLLQKLDTPEELNAKVQNQVNDALMQADKLHKRIGVFSTKVGNCDAAQLKAIVIENGKQTILQVDDAGKITVTLRDGDDETVEAYDNLDQLKVARPDFAARFDGLLEKYSTPKAPQK